MDLFMEPQNPIAVVDALEGFCGHLKVSPTPLPYPTLTSLTRGKVV